MSSSEQEDNIAWGIEYDNARDVTLSGFHSFRSANRLEGSRASETCLLYDLVARNDYFIYVFLTVVPGSWSYFLYD